MASRDVDIDIDIRTDLAILQRLNTQINSIISNIQRMGTVANSNFNSMITSANRYKQALHGIHSAQSSLNSLPPPTPLVAPAAAAATPTPATGAVPPVNNQMNQLAQGASALAIGTGFKKAGNMIVGAFTESIKVGLDFEQQMARVGTIAESTPGQLKRMTDAAIQLGADTTKSSSEVAVSMQELAAKGFDANKIIGAMPGIISAAEASGADLAVTSDVITSALNAFNLKATDSGHIADVMAMAANKTAADVGDMGYAFKYAAPVANNLGMSMESLAAATGLMMDKGLAGEQAGTSLRMGLLRLSALPKPAEKALKRLGVSAFDSNKKMKPLNGLIGDLKESMKGLSDQERVSEMKNIFGVEAATGWMNLISSGPAEIKKLTDTLVNSNGASEKAAARNRDTALGQLDQLKGNIEAFQLVLSKAFLEPFKNGFKAAAGYIQTLSNGFEKLSGPVKNAIIIFTVTVGVLASIAGAALIAWGGFMLLTAGLGITTGALWALIWPIAAVIAAIALVAAGIYYMWNQHAWFRDGVIAAWTAIKTAAVTAWNGIVAAVSPAIAAVVTFVQSQLAVLKQLWSENGTQITNGFRAFWAMIVATTQIYFAVVSAIFTSGWAIIKGVVQVAWAGIQILISSAITLITGIIKTGLAIMRGDWEGAKTAISGTVRALGENIYNILKNIDLKQIGIDMMTSLANGITGAIGKVVGAAKGAWKAVKGAFGSGSVKSPGGGNTPVAGGFTPSHATGLERVPKDNYFANLHEDESVLTARQSNALRSAGMLSSTSSGKPVLNMDSPGSEYTPQSSPRPNTSKGPVSIVYSPQFSIDASGADADSIGKIIEEKMKNGYDYLSTVFGTEEAY